MDVVSLVAKFGAKKALKRWLAITEGNNFAFVESRRGMFEDWVLELLDRIRTNEEDLQALGLEVAALEHERALVVANYAEQAWKEPLDERRLMLAHLAAGIIDVRLTVAEHARVQRRIDELAANDVIALDAVARTCSRAVGGLLRQADESAQYAVADAYGATEALTAAGCLRADRGAWSSESGFTLVSAFGRLVLSAARSYAALRRDPYRPPGHENLAESRSVPHCATILDAALGAARNDLVRAGRRTSVRYLTRGWHHSGGQLVAPHPQGSATLSFEAACLSVTPAIQALLDRRIAVQQIGTPCSDIGIFLVRVDGRDTVKLDVHGPHDVLRWLADDLDAAWETPPVDR